MQTALKPIEPMNSRVSSLLLLSLSILLGLLQFSCSPPEEPAPSPVPDDFQLDKLQAFDQFFVQRAFPEDQIDLKSYTQTLRQVAATASRNDRVAPSGFDSDWITQGPGNLGGRVNTIAIHPFDKQIIYIGFSTGGVFKTTNGGQDWSPIFDQQATLSIGHITIDPVFPDVIYVGTGDPNISAFPFIGDGLYRSPDGGATWQHLGLTDQRIISKVIVSPLDFNTLYVASMGLPFERNNSRGVYRSVDAGANWEQVLYLSDSTGIIDMVMNPNNPQVIYASTWDRIRNNSESVVYGNGAGVYKTEDGGDNWTQLTSGLPTGKFSRVNLAMSKINPSIVYAIYVDTTFQVHAIYKSINAGASWTTITQGGPGSQLASALGGQGWYNSRIATHPNNDNELYLLGINLWKTTSSGASWVPVVPPPGSLRPHVDNHALAFTIDADLVLGTDGGLYYQEADSDIWRDIESIAATQFYRTGYNPHDSAMYYGGAQDNGISTGNSEAPNNWEVLQQGDGFRTLFHPVFSRKYFVELPFGRLLVTTNNGQDYTLATFGIANTDSKNWDSPVLISRHFGDRMFMATDRVYTAISPSIFNQWSPISPQLTDFTNPVIRSRTISALAESPVRDSLLYAGTSDGLLWRTQDAGGAWTRIDAGLPERYVTSMEASPNQEQMVYATFSGYRDNDNSPLIYRSNDKGENWVSISGDLPQIGINDLIVLPNNLDQVFFVATDAGVYASLNDGVNWNRLGGNMPIVPVFDLELNIKKKEIVAATFGRSIMSFSLDSIGLNLDAPPLVHYSGAVKNTNNEGIREVELTYEVNNFSRSTQTDADGLFSLNDLLASTDCEIKAAKNSNHRNGLTTFDLVLIQKHILDVTLLDSPLKILAADANRSNSVTTFDMVLIRKIILQIDTAFQQSESWRFIPADFIFDHPDNPFLDSVPEIYDCSNIAGGNDQVFFTGLKVGDTNFSANPMLLQASAEGRNITDTLFFEVEDQLLERGEEAIVELKANDFKDILGFQATFRFDPRQITIENIEGASLDLNAQQNFGWTHRSKGALTCSWNDLSTPQLQDKDILFKIKIKALRKTQLSEALQLTSDYITAEAYQEGGTFLLPQLQFQKKASPANEFILHANAPNPFNQETQICFYLPESARVTLRIFDLKGQLIYEGEEAFGVGEQTIRVFAEWLEGTGVYVYELGVNGEKQIEKLFFVEEEN